MTNRPITPTDIPPVPALTGASGAIVEQLTDALWLVDTSPSCHGADGTLVQAHDVHERVRASFGDGLHDTLTGVDNEQVFIERTTHALTSRRLETRMVAALYINIDDFRNVNEQFGEAAGDEVLRVIASRLTSRVPSCGTVARLTADQFAILLEDVSERDDARHAAEQILRIINQPILFGNSEISVSACIGIALAGPSVDTRTLMGHADAAMYRAKWVGGSNIRVYSASMFETAGGQSTIREDIQRALANHELRLLFQPILDIETDQTVALEALVRWQHPIHGLIEPSSFLPALDGDASTVDAGTWVITEAARTFTRFQEAASHSEVKLHINIARQQLIDRYLVPTVIAILQEHGVPASAIVFELPEMEFSIHPDAISNIRALAAIGVGIAVSDRGDNPSLYIDLDPLPIDYVKFDRTYMMLQGTEGDAVMKAAVDHAISAGYQPIAERIETHDELHRAAAAGARYYQGYVHCKPMDIKLCSRYLHSATPSASTGTRSTGSGTW